MSNRNTPIKLPLAAVLLFVYSLPAESLEITIKGTPTFNLENPIQIQGNTPPPTAWEYRFYPSQTGPEVAVQCEGEAYRFLEAVRNAGQENWELVNVINAGPDEYNDPCLIGIFKRPVNKSE